MTSSPSQIRYKAKKAEIMSLFFLQHRYELTRRAKLDLREILVNQAEEVGIHYPDILPDNVRLVSFSAVVQPLVVLFKPPIFEGLRNQLGSSYWGNILLWEDLLDSKRAAHYTHRIRKSWLKGVKILDVPIIYVDSSDSFVQSVLEQRKKGPFDDRLSAKVYRYFKYLQYLPLAIYNESSCIIFFEVIDSLEQEIAGLLGAACPPPFVDRLKPDSKLFLAYFVTSQ